MSSRFRERTIAVAGRNSALQGKDVAGNPLGFASVNVVGVVTLELTFKPINTVINKITTVIQQNTWSQKAFITNCASKAKAPLPHILGHPCGYCVQNFICWPVHDYTKLKNRDKIPLEFCPGSSFPGPPPSLPRLVGICNPSQGFAGERPALGFTTHQVMILNRSELPHQKPDPKRSRAKPPNSPPSDWKKQKPDPPASIVRRATWLPLSIETTPVQLGIIALYEKA